MKQIERDGPFALIRAIMSSPPPRNRGGRKTNREAEVIRHIALGSTNKEIAAILSISIKTIEKHRQNAMKRFRLRNTADITRFAVAAKIIRVKYLKPNENNKKPREILDASSVKTTPKPKNREGQIPHRSREK